MYVTSTVRTLERHKCSQANLSSHTVRLPPGWAQTQVLAAASVVAFGPALILEYVPTAKVEVQDAASAGSTAGRVREG